MPKEPEERDHIRSLARGLDVILAFSQSRPRMTLSQVAEATGLSRPTARRILLTLEAHGYARSNGKTFALTPRVLALGYAYLSSLNLTEIAQPYMERVVERTQEGCALATLDQTEVVYVTRLSTQRISSITLATGTRLPAHATSMGHVLLAGLSESELQRYLAHADLRPLTGHTITRSEDLISRLDLVREQGYAIVDQELEHGLRSGAAPVKDSTGRVIAALALSAMTATTDEQTFREHHAPILVEAAHEISRELGADFSPQSGG
jgi:IclR family transcriptional regulator, pca regulon regulatory protein